MIVNAVQRIEQARARMSYTSTQENAWMVMAARAMAKDAGGVSLGTSRAAPRRARCIGTSKRVSFRSR